MNRLAAEHPEDERYATLEGQRDVLTEREDFDDEVRDRAEFDQVGYAAAIASLSFDQLREALIREAELRWKAEQS